MNSDVCLDYDPHWLFGIWPCIVGESEWFKFILELLSNELFQGILTAIIIFVIMTNIRIFPTA
jgi:hypothetical protein